LIKRTWTSRGPTGHRVRKVAHGYTLQVPCRPCPHRDTKTGEVLHPDGMRQVRVVNSAWSREDAEKALAAYLLGVEQEQAKPSAAASINRPLAALRHLFQLAHEEWGVLSAVPKIRLEKEPQGRIRWLEPDEEVRLLAACAKSRNPELTKIVTIALETGLRKG